MRIFIAVLILIFSFQSFAKADDISDFEIEGMSIGDSLLDYFSEEEINENIADEDYVSKKFYDVNIYDGTFSTYVGVQIAIKTNDTKYIIQGIDGLLSYRNKNIEQCFKKKKVIIKDLLTIFKNAEKYDRKKIQHPSYPGSFTTDTFLTLSSEDQVVISCYDFSKNLEAEGYYDQLRISLWTKELNDWLIR